MVCCEQLTVKPENAYLAEHYLLVRSDLSKQGPVRTVVRCSAAAPDVTVGHGVLIGYYAVPLVARRDR